MRSLPRPLSRLASFLVLAAAVPVLGCGGAKRYKEDPNWQSKDSIALDEAEPAPAQDGFGLDWVGVRPDLAIAQTHPRRATCSCLTVEVGQPTDAKFTWEATPPQIRGNKLALAISAFGIDCPGGPTDQAERRPSIAGVYRQGRDVVIEVEDISVERPVASGAILHPPDTGGAILIRPRGRSVPYGRPSAGELCRVQ